MCSDVNEPKCPNIPCPQGSAQPCDSSWQPVICPPIQPLCCQITMLRPAINYTVAVSAESAAGQGENSVTTIKTDLIGELQYITCNIISLYTKSVIHLLILPRMFTILGFYS